MKIDGEPFESLPIQGDGGADPYIHVLSKDLIAYKGCGRFIEESQNEDCDNTWRVLRPSKKSAVPIHLSGFGTLGQPIFRNSYMAFSVRLPNGNGGCKVYDWNKETFLVQWDSGSVPKGGVGIQFGKDGLSVTCREITEWVPNPNYAGGDEPRQTPVFGKVQTYALSAK
jgi:hypothetical protein